MITAMTAADLVRQRYARSTVRYSPAAHPPRTTVPVCAAGRATTNHTPGGNP